MKATSTRLSFLSSLKKRKGLLIIITAALLLEFLSGTQYYFTHRLLEKELELRAESELTMKAILIKSNLNDAEEVLNLNMWKIQAHLNVPDSTYITMPRLVSFSPLIQGVAIAFEPYYYPQKGKWFEVYARRNAKGEVETVQIGGPEHDYTQRDFYRQAFTAERGSWVDPYYDNEGAKGHIPSFVRPVFDRTNKPVGVASIDVSLEQLTDTIDRRHIYPSSFIIVLTEDGNPVLGPSEERVSRATTEFVMQLINDSTVTRQPSRSGRTKIIHFDTDRRDGTVFYANMKGQPHWQIAVVCYDDEVFASLNKLRVLMLLLLLLAFGVLLFLVWRFARDEKLLQQKTLEQERTDGELRIASNIQRTLLPEDESLPRISDVQIEGRLIPAKAVGGDLYNVFERDGKLFFCIGDVSGKGVPAAIIMAITQALFRNIASHSHHPAHIMEQMNEASCRNNKENIFVTLFVGVLDLPTGRLRYCNAGHEIPIITSTITSSLSLDAKPNLPIGLFNDFKYEMQETTMQPGDTLFLYTDGLTEARNIRRELFGRERVLRLMSSLPLREGLGVGQFVDNIVMEVQRFADGAEQSDDLTLLAIRYTPKEEKLILNESLTLHNDVKEVTTLSAFIKEVLARLEIGKPLAPKLRLALEEAVVNVMEYAYPTGTKGEVGIRVTSDGQQLKFIITDSGISFNPTEVATADTTLSAEERPVGGLGILLVRELMDSINYERTNGKNVLTLLKNVKIIKCKNE